MIADKTHKVLNDLTDELFAQLEALDEKTEIAAVSEATVRLASVVARSVGDLACIAVFLDRLENSRGNDTSLAFSAIAELVLLLAETKNLAKGMHDEAERTIAATRAKGEAAKPSPVVH